MDRKHFNFDSSLKDDLRWDQTQTNLRDAKAPIEEDGWSMMKEIWEKSDDRERME